MTESMLSNRVLGTLTQIKEAIKQLHEWNKDILSVDDYYNSPEGMKNLAASCMLIEAIGEGVKQIDKLTQSKLLIERPEIPWQDGNSFKPWNKKFHSLKLRVSTFETASFNTLNTLKLVVSYI